MKRTQLVVLALAMAAPVASAAGVISWNFDNNSTVGGDGAGSLPDVGAQAGVVLAGGWSNSFPDNPTTDLRDDDGNPTTLDIVPESTNGSYAIAFSHPGQDNDGSWNKEMINGYLNAGGGGTSSVAMTEIPYANYDIYVYFTSDNDAREGSVTVGSISYYFNTVGAASTAGADALLIPTSDTVDDPTDVDANYAVFSGLSGASQTVTVDVPEFGGLAAFQVVQIPEPSIALLGGLGMLGLLRRRRA